MGCIPPLCIGGREDPELKSSPPSKSIEEALLGAAIGVTGAGNAVGVTGAGNEGVDGGLMSTPPNRSRPALLAAGGGLDGPALKLLMTNVLV